VVKLHSYTTHLTYSFVVEHGDIWGMRDSTIFDPVEEEEVEEGGGIPCSWVLNQQNKNKIKSTDRLLSHNSLVVFGFFPRSVGRSRSPRSDRSRSSQSINQDQ